MSTVGRHFRFSPWPIALALAAIAMAVGVFVVTQGVQRREGHVGELNRQLLSEQQTMRVLNAEWAYLTRPQRLEELMVMKSSQQGEMPPAPIPVANVVPMEPVAQVTPAPEVAKVEPASGETEKPVDVKKPAAKIAAIKDKTPVNKSAVKKSVVVAKAKPKAKNNDDVWRITKKTLARAPAQMASNMPTPRRAGIAHPIVE